MQRIPEFIANHLFLVTLFFALLILLLWNVFGALFTGVELIEPGEATRLINREGAFVLDVRDAPEFAAGHILNAANIPGAEVIERQKELESYRTKPLIVSCENGSKSARVARLLKLVGFERPLCLKGGLSAWKGASLPLTRDAA